MSSRKTSSKLGRWLAYAALAVLAILGGDLAANAIDISQPSNSTIQGASICSGSPTRGGLLYYDGSCWGGATTIAGNLTIGAGSGQFSPQLVLTNNGNGNSVIATSSNDDLAIGPSDVFSFEKISGTVTLATIDGSGNFTPGGAIKWNNATDLTQTNESRTPWSCYLRTVSGVATAKAICEYYPAKNTHIQTISYAGLTAAAGCTTNPVVALFDGSTEITASAITLTTNSAVAAQSVGYAFTGGHALSLQVATAPAGCTTSAADYTFTAELTTD